MMRTVIAMAAAALTVALVSPSQAATWEDTRPCVTPQEVWSTSAPLTRAQLENRWEVTGKGTYTYLAFFDYWAYVYPMCDNDPRLAFARFQGGTLAAVGIIDQ